MGGGDENSPQVLCYLKEKGDWEAHLIRACAIFEMVGQVCEVCVCRGFVFVLCERVEGSVFLILISILVTDVLAHGAFLTQ